MDYKCNVLWVDDQNPPVEDFESCCEEDGIYLEKCLSRDAGIKEMELNAKKYDCVILDVNMDDKENKQETIQSLQRIRDVALKNRLHVFIFTGDPKYMSDADFATYMGTYYDKGNPAEEEALRKKILEVYDNKTETKLREQYQDVFASTKKLGINSVCDRIILPILKNIHYPSDDFDAMVYYTSIRRLIEHIFRAFNKKGILPNEFLPKNELNIDQSFWYLSGGTPDYIHFRYGKENDYVFPKYISNSIKQLIYLGDIQSHSVDLSEKDNDTVKQILDTANANYFLEGALLQMCDVLIWTANNIDSKEDKRVSTQVPQEIIDKYVGTGKTFNPVHIKDNLWHVDDILIKSSKPLKNVEIIAISGNTDEETKGDFTFFARYKKI